MNKIKFFKAVFLLTPALFLMACADKDEKKPESTTVPFFVKVSNLDTHPECDGSADAEPVVYIFNDFDGFVDDKDENEPNPVNVESQFVLDGENYIFNIEFDEPGAYRLSVTCESNLDLELVDDDISFTSRKGVYLRVGDLVVISDDDTLPETHLSVKSTCTGCHLSTQEYDVAFIDHQFVEGFCADCHN